MKRILLNFFVVTLIIINTLSTTAFATTVDNETPWPAGPNPNNLSAESAIVMEVSTGTILYEKNIHTQHYPASITKIMTTLLALENSSLGQTVTFSHDAIFGIERDSSHIGINVGEELTVEESLYAIMLASANEVSLGIAEHVAGSTSDFAHMMNKKAKELGCLNTNFVNPNGLHDDNHYTTAHDMALISSAAIQNSTFKEITKTTHYILPPTNIQPETRYLNCHHQMLSSVKYKYDYCIGGKTGYTSNSKWTLVTFAEKDGVELVCVVMRALGPTSPQNEYTDTTDLLNFAFENYVKYPIGNTDDLFDSETPLFTRFNPLFDFANSPLQISSNSSIILPSKVDFKNAKQTVAYNIKGDLVQGDNIIGKVSYAYGDKIVGYSNIIYNTTQSPTLSKGPFMEKLLQPETTDLEEKRNLKPLIISIIILIFILIIFFYFYLSLRKKRRRQFFYNRHKNNF